MAVLGWYDIQSRRRGWQDCVSRLRKDRQMSDEKSLKQVEVWGSAKGTGSTEGAARGAFTTRRYPNRDWPRGDWLEVLSAREVDVQRADTA